MPETILEAQLTSEGKALFSGWMSVKMDPEETLFVAPPNDPYLIGIAHGVEEGLAHDHVVPGRLPRKADVNMQVDDCDMDVQLQPAQTPMIHNDFVVQPFIHTCIK